MLVATPVTRSQQVTGVARIYREEALDIIKVSSVAASTTSLGRQFHSLLTLIVLGKKEELLYCVLAGMSWNCLL